MHRKCHFLHEVVTVNKPKLMACSMICGHEFIGEVVVLGESFTSETTKTGRPALYGSLKVGNKVVSPFTVSCGECQ